MSLTVYSMLSSEQLVCKHTRTTEPTDNMFELHSHDISELIYFVSGEIAYFIDGVRHPVRPGELYWVNPHIPHRISIEGNAPYERYDLLIGEEMMPHLARSAFPRERQFISLEATPNVRSIFERMDGYYGRYACDQERLFEIYSCLVGELCCNIFFDRTAYLAPDTSRSGLVRRALEYIDANLLQINTVDELCEKLFVSKSYFHRLFTEAMGTGPMDYIRLRRLNLARDALRCGEKATEVYKWFGFGDYSAFYRSYKAAFGCPPSEESNRLDRRSTNETPFGKLS